MFKKIDVDEWILIKTDFKCSFITGMLLNVIILLISLFYHFDNIVQMKHILSNSFLFGSLTTLVISIFCILRIYSFRKIRIEFIQSIRSGAIVLGLFSGYMSIIILGIIVMMIKFLSSF